VEWGASPVSALPAFQLVAIAASAGGISALAEVLSQLPAAFPLPVTIVQHIDPHHQSSIAHILSRSTPLVVKQAGNEDLLTPGTVYVAPPGSHMEIDDVRGCRRIRLALTELVHFVRPSADRLFESAAESCSPVIAVVLTGSGTDGAAGARAVKRAGGIVIAQDEQTSEFFGMPQAAIESGAVAMILPLDRIAQAILKLARGADGSKQA